MVWVWYGSQALPLDKSRLTLAAFSIRQTNTFFARFVWAATYEIFVLGTHTYDAYDMFVVGTHTARSTHTLGPPNG